MTSYVVICGECPSSFLCHVGIFADYIKEWFSRIYFASANRLACGATTFFTQRRRSHTPKKLVISQCSIADVCLILCDHLSIDTAHIFPFFMQFSMIQDLLLNLLSCAQIHFLFVLYKPRTVIQLKKNPHNLQL